jgi:hypothetical protein
MRRTPEKENIFLYLYGKNKKKALLITTDTPPGAGV